MDHETLEVLRLQAVEVKACAHPEDVEEALAGLPVVVVDPAHRTKRPQSSSPPRAASSSLFYLPGYSPELNPDEWARKNVKHDPIHKTGVTSADDLKAKAASALRRLQKLPALVREFFHDPHLRYITTVDMPFVPLASRAAY